MLPKTVASLVAVTLWCSSGSATADQPLNFPNSQLEPTKWSELAGWRADDHLAAFTAYQTSCQSFRKSQLIDKRGPLYRALWNLCRSASGMRPPDRDTARAFFEENFQPVRIARLGEVDGLLTGYFEPVVRGSRFPSPEFHVPVYRRPPDLIAAGRKLGSVAFPNKGVRIGRLNNKNELVPYYDRAAIEAGALDGQKLEICWLKDPFDLLAIQIEGSGRVILEDGTPLRINYDSHNGYPFTSLSRALVERNLISREDLSTKRIREWMAAHPEDSSTIHAANRSYVFFRITGLTNEGEPIGAQGVPLIPGRSIAVDRLHEYGTPFFIEASLPIDNAKPPSPFRRLMIAQDTGSAIVGPARADLYWGAGDEAARIAARIHHPARFVMLLPREIDINENARHVPLPTPRPKVLEVAQTSKGDKAKVDSARDEHWPRQVGALTSPLRDCAAASTVYCSHKSVVPIMNKHLPIGNRRPTGANGQQNRNQQDGLKQRAAEQAQPRMQGAPIRQQQRIEGRIADQKEHLQATEHHAAQNKQRPPTTQGRASQEKQLPQAVERYRPPYKQQPITTVANAPQQKRLRQATEHRSAQQKQSPQVLERRGTQEKKQSQTTERNMSQRNQQPVTVGSGAQQKQLAQSKEGRDPRQKQQPKITERRVGGHPQ
jgi:membrane-bound lytic murein transglycosylase A